jgi:hypothetical protein
MTTPLPTPDWSAWLARSDVAAADKVARLAEYIAAHQTLPPGCDFLWSETSKLVATGQPRAAVLPQLFPRLAPQQLAVLLRSAAETNTRTLFAGLIAGSTQDASLTRMLSTFVQMIDEERLCALVRSLGQLAGLYPMDEPVMGQRLLAVLRKLPQDAARFAPRLAAIRAGARWLPQGDDRIRAWRQVHESLARFTEICEKKSGPWNVRKLGAERDEAAQQLVAALAQAMPADWYADDRQASVKRQLLAGLIAEAKLPAGSLPRDFDKKAANYFQSGKWAVPAPPPKPKAPPKPKTAAATGPLAKQTAATAGPSNAAGGPGLPRRIVVFAIVFGMPAMGVLIAGVTFHAFRGPSPQVADGGPSPAAAWPPVVSEPDPDVPLEILPEPTVTPEMSSPAEAKTEPAPARPTSAKPTSAKPTSAKPTPAKPTPAKPTPAKPTPAKPDLPDATSQRPMPPTPPRAKPNWKPATEFAPEPPRASRVRSDPEPGVDVQLKPLLEETRMSTQGLAATAPVEDAFERPGRNEVLRGIGPGDCLLRLHGAELARDASFSPEGDGASDLLQAMQQVREFVELESRFEGGRFTVAARCRASQGYDLASFGVDEQGTLYCDAVDSRQEQDGFALRTILQRDALRYCVLEVCPQARLPSQWVALLKPLTIRFVLDSDGSVPIQKTDRNRLRIPNAAPWDQLYLGAGTVLHPDGECAFGSFWVAETPRKEWPLQELTAALALAEAATIQLVPLDGQIGLLVKGPEAGGGRRLLDVQRRQLAPTVERKKRIEKMLLAAKTGRRPEDVAKTAWNLAEEIQLNNRGPGFPAPPQKATAPVVRDWAGGSMGVNPYQMQAVDTENRRRLASYQMQLQAYATWLQGTLLPAVEEELSSLTQQISEGEEGLADLEDWEQGVQRFQDWLNSRVEVQVYLYRLVPCNSSGGRRMIRVLVVEPEGAAIARH